MQDLNIRRCNSSSTVSGCIERNLLKVIIALSGNNGVAEVSKITLTGGFSYLNTRFGFDT